MLFQLHNMSKMSRFLLVSGSFFIVRPVLGWQNQTQIEGGATVSILEAASQPASLASATVQTQTSDDLPLTPGGQSSSIPSDQVAVLQEEAAEELLHGPVHEAFAEPYTYEPVEGIVADREPPPPVPEVPPEVKPTGSNVEWINGYWFWDNDRDDYIWISGVWRQLPPGKKWLPGYWSQRDEQFHWVGGTWIETDSTQLQYLPDAPPATLELGPVGTAPSTNHFWVPGSWVWNQPQYVWRPGYWTVGYSNWVWVPQRYVWTPRGYMHCNGYWDYPWLNRGTLFAPVWFRQPVYFNRGFHFMPRMTILLAGMQRHLWVRPSYRHYYFGNYYGSNYNQFGLYPWHAYHLNSSVGFGGRRIGGYDPLFAYASRVSAAEGVNLSRQLGREFQRFVSQPDLRPPRTFSEQRARGNTTPFVDDARSRGRSGSFQNPWTSDNALGEAIRDVVDRNPNSFTRDHTRETEKWVRTGSRDMTRNLSALRREFESKASSNVERSSDSQAEFLRELARTARNQDNQPGSGRSRTDRPGSAQPRSDQPRTVEEAIRRRVPDHLTRDRSPGSSPVEDQNRQVNPRQGNQAPAERTSRGRLPERPGLDRSLLPENMTRRPIVPERNVPNVNPPNLNRPNLDRPIPDRPNLNRPIPDLNRAEPRRSPAIPNAHLLNPGRNPAVPNLNRTLPERNPATPNFDRSSPNLNRAVPDVRRAVPNLNPALQGGRRVTPDGNPTVPNLRQSPPTSRQLIPGPGTSNPGRLPSINSSPNRGSLPGQLTNPLRGGSFRGDGGGSRPSGNWSSGGSLRIGPGSGGSMRGGGSSDRGNRSGGERSGGERSGGERSGSGRGGR